MNLRIFRRYLLPFGFIFYILFNATIANKKFDLDKTNYRLSPLEGKVSPGNIDPSIDKYDSDRDGLFNDKEILVGTDRYNADTDGDNLSDYDELTKYFLDPLKKDTDDDGIIDSDSVERKEYTWTITATCKISPPNNYISMNDHFQDVLPLKDIAGNLTYEVTIYLLAFHIAEQIPLEDTRLWYVGMEKNLVPTGLMNFDNEMQSDIQNVLGVKTTWSDLDLVKAMYAWEQKNITKMPGANNSGHYPEPFLDLYEKNDGSINYVRQGFSDFKGELGDKEWILQHLVYGKSMYKNRTRGSCGSTANFHSTLLRCLGIPTRIIQTVPLLNPEDIIQRSKLKNLDSLTEGAFLYSKGYNHFMCEAYVGGRWLRIDNDRFCTESGILEASTITAYI